MRKVTLAALLGAAAISLAGCGGGEAAGNGAADPIPGDSVNAADGSINVSGDASGTTGSTTGDAGGPLNIEGDGQNDAAEANGTSSNEQ